MTHTPGPWIAVGQSVYAQTPQDIDHSRFRGYSEREPHGFLISESTPHEPTCRLIASAPDLLAALQALMSEVEASGNANAMDFGWPKAVAAARAAIAKAKGE